MTAFIFWLIGLATIIIQTSLLQGLPQWCNRPDFLFILMVFVTYRLTWAPGVIVVFLLGWIMDVVSGIHLGFSPLIYLLFFVALKVLSYGNPLRESNYQIPLLGATWLAAKFLQHIIFSLWLDQMVLDWQWGQHLLDASLLMIIAIPLFALYNKLFCFLQRR